MSASLIAEVIIIPFSGWLARLLSARYLFLISLGGFLLASLGYGFSNNFFSIIIFRELSIKYPIINLEIFYDKNFTIGCI